jgi:hypothetical protein
MGDIQIYDKGKSVLASGNLRKAIYETWKAGEPIDINDVSPNDILNRMLRASVNLEGMGMIAPLEKIAINLVQMAMEGDKWAMEKVWLEAQHQGIAKHELGVRVLDPIDRHILQMQGILDDTGAMVDTTPVVDSKPPYTPFEEALAELDD